MSASEGDAQRVVTLEKRLARAQKKVAVLERMIEDQTRSLFLANEERERMTRFLEKILETMTSALLVVNAEGDVTRVNRELRRLIGMEADQGCGVEGLSIDVGQLFPDLIGSAPVVSTLADYDGETSLCSKDGEVVPVLFKGAPLFDEAGGLSGAVCLAHDITEMRRLELELRHAQKLESVGQLAAGLAHEVNTPIQFVGDSVNFLGEAFEDLQVVLELARKMRVDAALHEALGEHCANFDEGLEDLDFDFVVEEVPAAVTRALAGIDRVSKIVSAMQTFAHPSNSVKSEQDLNAAIETTLEVCQAEYRYVADVEQDLGEIPKVHCKLGDINQVLLDLIVNAAHAIASSIEGSTQRGRIRVATRASDSHVEIVVEDNGSGIPIEVRDRIFDPFFTTKEVGSGTGQGLAIARRLIVEGHGGTLDFESEVGVGTTFRIRLPIDA